LDRHLKNNLCVNNTNDANFIVESVNVCVLCTLCN